MACDCHIHMVLDGLDWKTAIGRHAERPHWGFTRKTLGPSRALGFT